MNRDMEFNREKEMAPLKDRIKKAKLDRNFLQMFIDERQVVTAGDKMALVRFDDFYVGIANSMIKFKNKSKNDKEYTSATINKLGDYNTFYERKNKSGEYEKYDEAVLKGKDIAEIYGAYRKANKKK